jgi:biotin synthase-like enzyme
MDNIIERSNKIYLDNFPKTGWFGRCIFLSWYCDLGTCKFCFRSTTKHKIKHKKRAKRSLASILTDALFGVYFGWRIEFLTGGYRIFSFDELLEKARLVSKIFGHKLWINLGTLKEDQLIKLKPYVEGVCASIETIDEQLHNDVCPDKPIKPYSDFLKLADKHGFKKSMTIVVGLGEKKEDFSLLAKFIEEHKLDRITFYALKPVKGTEFENVPSPDIDYYSWWIAKTRIRFPKLEIIAGLTPKTPGYAGQILRAGANAITKFPILRKYGTEDAKLINELAEKNGRPLTSKMVEKPNKEKIFRLLESKDLDKEIEQEVKNLVEMHLRRIEKNIKKYNKINL